MISHYSWEHRSKKIESKLISLLHAPLSLVITDNTSSLISSKKINHIYTVRLHHMFLDASEDVLRSLAKYLSGNRNRIDNTLEDFIKENEEKIRKHLKSRKTRTMNIVHEGRYFNLLDSFQKINKRYFEGRIHCTITWGNRRRGKKPKSVRLGSYSPDTDTIRINPVLDRPFVPLYVVDDIIYHEMLHHLVGFKEINGRHLSHHRIFKKMEKKFIHNAKAKIWVKENLPRLLQYKQRT